MREVCGMMTDVSSRMYGSMFVPSLSDILIVSLAHYLVEAKLPGFFLELMVVTLVSPWALYCRDL